MTPAREWRDKRDNTYWMLWLERGDRPVLAFADENGERHTIEVDFENGLDDKSDHALQELLDRVRG